MDRGSEVKSCMEGGGGKSGLYIVKIYLFNFPPSSYFIANVNISHILAANLGQI